MPDEAVDSKLGPLDAYLVEARSIGGLSGSPVFVNLGLHRKINGQIMQAGGEHGMFNLLGMMHGHYAVKTPISDEVTVDRLSDEVINMGIAIVIPADCIVAVINSPEMVKMREKAERETAATDGTATV